MNGGVTSIVVTNCELDAYRRTPDRALIDASAGRVFLDDLAIVQRGTLTIRAAVARLAIRNRRRVSYRWDRAWGPAFRRLGLPAPEQVHMARCGVWRDDEPVES